MLGRIRRAKAFLESVQDAYESVPERRTPSLARQAYLALLDPETGKLHPDHHFAVAGAIYAELWSEGRLEVTEAHRSARVGLRDPTPLGNPELDEAMLDIGAALLSTKVKHRAEGLGVSTKRYVERDLERAGLLVREERKALGLVTVRRLRLTSTLERDEVVGRLRSVLTGASVPDDRTTLLLIAVHAGASLRPLLARSERKEGERRARALRGSADPDLQAVLARVGEASLRD